MTDGAAQVLAMLEAFLVVPVVEVVPPAAPPPVAAAPPPAAQAFVPPDAAHIWSRMVFNGIPSITKSQQPACAAHVDAAQVGAAPHCPSAASVQASVTTSAAAITKKERSPADMVIVWPCAKGK